MTFDARLEAHRQARARRGGPPYAWCSWDDAFAGKEGHGRDCDAATNNVQHVYGLGHAAGLAARSPAPVGAGSATSNITLRGLAEDVRDSFDCLCDDSDENCESKDCSCAGDACFKCAALMALANDDAAPAPATGDAGAPRCDGKGECSTYFCYGGHGAVRSSEPAPRTTEALASTHNEGER